MFIIKRVEGTEDNERERLPGAGPIPERDAGQGRHGSESIQVSRGRVLCGEAARDGETTAGQDKAALQLPQR